MVPPPTHPPKGLLTVGHHKMLILKTSLVPCGQKERLFSKMQHSFLFIRSTVAKVKVLDPLVWKTQVSLYMGPTGAVPRITQREPSGGKMRVIMQHGDMVKAIPSLLTTVLHILIIQRKHAVQNWF